MANLKSIVASLDLCRKIPAGEFGDSALVHREYQFCEGGETYHDVIPRVTPCEDVGGEQDFYPAPTLAEVLAEIAHSGVILDGIELGGNLEFTIKETLNGRKEDDNNPADAALRLWLRLKGNEVE